MSNFAKGIAVGVVATIVAEIVTVFVALTVDEKKNGVYTQGDFGYGL